MINSGDMLKGCVEKVDPLDPQAQVLKGNPWYVREQFSAQLGRAGTRALIQRRWESFGGIILRHLETRCAEGAGPVVRFLDAGCGDGINLQWAGEFFQDRGLEARISAVDFNPLRVERVRSKGLAHDAQVASLLELPFPDGSFDIVLCNHVLEHVHEYRRALDQLARVLHPGGLLVVGVPNEGCLLARMRNHVFQRSILRSTDHVNFFTGQALEGALLASGFRLAKLHREGFFLPHFWLHYALSRFEWGEKLLFALGRIWPAQSAGVIAHAVKR